MNLLFRVLRSLTLWLRGRPASDEEKDCVCPPPAN